MQSIAVFCLKAERCMTRARVEKNPWFRCEGVCLRALVLGELLLKDAFFQLVSFEEFFQIVREREAFFAIDSLGGQFAKI